MEDNLIYVSEFNKLLSCATYLYVDGRRYEWLLLVLFCSIYSCLLTRVHHKCLISFRYQTILMLSSMGGLCTLGGQSL